MKTKISPFTKCYPEQKNIARDVFSGNYSFVTVKAGRQAGKSYILDRSAVGLSLRENGIEVIWITPTHPQSLDAFERIELMLNDKIGFKTTKSTSDRRITFDNGSRIRFFSAERYNNLRGKHPDYLVLDEFAFFKKGAWEYAIKPYFIANKKLVALVASTSCGKNDFYTLWDKYLQGQKGYINHKLHYTMNPNANLEFIQAEKDSLPVQVFSQEYDGEFVFGSSSVFGDFVKNQLVIHYRKYSKLRKYYFGLDISGQGDDKTVLTIVNDLGETVLVYEVDATDLLKQRDELIDVLKGFPNITGYGEKNGLGAGLCELLINKGINLIEWITTNESKQDLVKELMISLNSCEIKLPTSTLCPKLDNEMCIYKVSRTSTGKLTYSHPSGLHDDYVDSLMMANKARKDLVDQEVVVEQPYYEEYIDNDDEYSYRV